MSILLQYYDQIHIPANEIQECQKHGAGQEIGKLVETGFLIVHQDFNASENDAAKAIAEAIAENHFTRDKNWAHHLPESFAIVLMLRSNLGAGELLLDELAAREVARLRKIPIIGFPGVLIRACQHGMMDPEEVRSLLETCRRQGTHYSPQFIDEVYEKLKRP
jgi:predicted nucleic acid-binding protein